MGNRASVPMDCAEAYSFYRRNKELSILIGVALYTLNIIEANVDAHLKQFNVDEQLTLEPFIHNDLLTQPQFGLTLTYKIQKINNNTW